MREVELYCKTELKEAVKLDRFQHRHFQSSTGLLTEFYVKTSNGSEKPIATATKDECFSELLVGFAYSHTMNFPIAICAAQARKE